MKCSEKEEGLNTIFILIVFLKGSAIYMCKFFKAQKNSSSRTQLERFFKARKGKLHKDCLGKKKRRKKSTE